MVELFATSTDFEVLKYSWIEWRKASGNQYREQYLDYLELQNEGAQSIGFENLQELWLSHYESEDFTKLIDKVWTEPQKLDDKHEISLEQFYKQFHAYVRGKLRNFYADQGADIKQGGYIPAHLLGNMWAQQWDNIEPLVKPFDNTPILDVTEAMKAQVFKISRFWNSRNSRLCMHYL